MAFRELQAMQDAYELLSPLDQSAQQRVLAWLSAALADSNVAPTAGDEHPAPVLSVTNVPAQTAPGESVTDGVAEHAKAGPQPDTAAPTAPDAVAAAGPDLAVEPAPNPRPQLGRSAQANGRRAAKAAKSAPAATPARGAQTRRGERPSGEQFRADLAAAGSFKALAEKYGKSIGTIGNWASQLREQGFDIPGGRQKRS